MARSRPRRGRYYIALLLMFLAVQLTAQNNILRDGTFTKARIISALKNQRAADIDTNSVQYKAWLKRMVDSLSSAVSPTIPDNAGFVLAGGWDFYPNNIADTANKKNVLCVFGNIRTLPIAQFSGTGTYGGFAANIGISGSASGEKEYFASFSTLIYPGLANVSPGDKLFIRFWPNSSGQDKHLKLYRLSWSQTPEYVSSGTNYGEIIGDIAIPDSYFPASTSVYIEVTLSYYRRHS